ncbi:YncE family protein [Rhodococcus erythropolis]|uniref:YncE family protein n=1 Tax=Rhodococcus erythropolis TaxID=1833 RepID=UPI002948CB83|nr:YncE family protein [Rhodococcus erythropolis]MDV6278613.1 YncE family protein [Rhodococcus erythropolis]
MSVVETATNTVTVTVGAFPRGVAMTPNGEYAHVTNSHSNDTVVSVIDTTTNTVIGDPIPVGANPQGVAITPERHPRLRHQQR